MTFYQDENTYWKRLTENTWLDRNTGEIINAFDFKLSDEYGKKCLVPGLENYLNKEILDAERLIKLELITKENRIIKIKKAFNQLKQVDLETKILNKINHSDINY